MRNEEKILRFLLILIIPFFLFSSCNSSDNLIVNGRIKINKSDFIIKADYAIYDIDIEFESKVSFNLIYIYNDSNYIEKYNDLKRLKILDIDLGKYILKCEVTNLNGIAEINYKIHFLKKNYWYKSRYESEPNNSFDTATDFIISSYSTYSKVGRILNSEDSDFYKISNDTYFDINCHISISKASEEDFSIVVYDSNYNIIAKINRNIPFTFRSKSYYYLKISSIKSDFGKLPYTIIINPITSVENLTEFEINDSKEQANIIDLNQIIYGELIEKDTDYFYFDIEKEGFFKIIFSSSSFPFSITFVSDFGTFYGDYQMHRAGSFRHLLLPKGRYYIKLNLLNNTKILNLQYSIKVEYDSPAFEIEPNDNDNQANEFTIYDLVSGSISWEYDIDFFLIVLEKLENNIIINVEDPTSTLQCQIFVDDSLYSSFEITNGSHSVNIKGQKVIIKLFSSNFTKEIAYTIKVGN